MSFEFPQPDIQRLACGYTACRSQLRQLPKRYRGNDKAPAFLFKFLQIAKLRASQPLVRLKPPNKNVGVENSAIQRFVSQSLAVSNCRMSPWIVTLPFHKPFSRGFVEGAGTNMATCFPRFVMITEPPDACTSSRMRRHLLLNSAAGVSIVLIIFGYYQGRRD